MTFVLRFTPLAPKEGLGQYHPPTAPHYWLVRLGDQWPRDPMKRLIDATSPRREDAKEFATEEDANSCLVTAGSPRGWIVEEAK